jgi:lipoyl-dependent peroxiredoxin
MAIRTGTAQWQGTLREGRGHMRFGGGAYDGAYTFASRFENGGGTNPEELIAAAHAGCFSMAFSADLERAGFPAKDVETEARVHLETVDGKPTVTQIDLIVGAEVPGIDKATFDKVAAGAKENCPISRLLKTSAKITLDATLKGA